MTCPSAGNCTAAGTYAPNYRDTCFPDNTCYAAFVVNERHGTWGQAIGPGGGSPTAVFGSVSALTCPATGDCVAAGVSVDGQGNVAGEVLSETNDRWAPPLIIASRLQVYSVSCASPGYCAAGGDGPGYGAYGNQAFVISEWHGAWGKAVTPAGIPARYGATVTAVACPPKITLCIAGGYETAANSTRAQPFIVSQAG
jgi:hypothetical protein